MLMIVSELMAVTKAEESSRAAKWAVDPGESCGEAKEKELCPSHPVHLVQSCLPGAPFYLMERAFSRAWGQHHSVGWDILQDGHCCGIAVGSMSTWEQNLPLLCPLLPRAAAEEPKAVVAAQWHPQRGQESSWPDGGKDGRRHGDGGVGHEIMFTRRCWNLSSAWP